MRVGTNSPAGLRGLTKADLDLRVAILRAAVVDDLIRKNDAWGHLARDAEGDPAFDTRTIAALLKGGLLEQLGTRDVEGRVLRVRTSTYGRRELARIAATEGS